MPELAASALSGQSCSALRREPRSGSGGRHASVARGSAVGLGALAPAAAQDAKDFPNRAIRIVVPFPAGGPADVTARIIAQKMSEDWGQPVIVENRAGGNTIVGAQIVAKAAPDGYTLLMAIDSTLVMNQFLYRSLPYDPFNDFEPITSDDQDGVGAGGVRRRRGPTSVKELIDRPRPRPASSTTAPAPSPRN